MLQLWTPRRPSHILCEILWRRHQWATMTRASISASWAAQPGLALFNHCHLHQSYSSRSRRVLTGLWRWAHFLHIGPVHVITVFSLVVKGNWVKPGSIWFWLYKWPDLVWASVSSRQEWAEQLDRCSLAVLWQFQCTPRRHHMEISGRRWCSRA